MNTAAWLIGSLISTLISAYLLDTQSALVGLMVSVAVVIVLHLMGWSH